MKNGFKLLCIGLVLSNSSFAFKCPDPEDSSLSWGEPTAPWKVNPFSQNTPQGGPGTMFVRANILVTSSLGAGVLCTYHNSVGDFSIWWQVRTKVPARSDYRWVNTLGGYVCNLSLDDCEFVAVG